MKKALIAIVFMWIMVTCLWIFDPFEEKKVDCNQVRAEEELQMNTYAPKITAEIIEQPESLKAYEDVPMKADEQIYMQQICTEQNISYEFALALMQSESNFDPKAIGDEGKSIGYFQINQVNWKRMQEEYGLDVQDSMDNITAGIMILRELFDKYEDPFQVIICYKAGERRGTELFDQGIYITDDYDCNEICLAATNYERSHGK